ncbi:right-handed parallel beta-helix repeat-containing protein [Engelhardtia mirabilis]|uniref:Right handed beta helix domain-containing protein n=1 Tax=Engelhardtia mirabilis TaxID=2528011 RepID=A0A518BPG5_9BACT|nr:hypothetical protein Pla133_39820 [Planctomycetes bacterium Pla133]QDV03199.1 hypothetical protein Pla86_39810 [Planctomycetes bacterium Pla86]
MSWLTTALVASAALGPQTTHLVPGDHGSIQAAIDFAADGDTVLVGPGVWAERIDLLGKRITVRSELGAKATVIDASGLDGSVVTAESGEPDGTRVAGFTLRGGSGGFNPANGRYYGGGVLVHGSNGLFTSHLAVEDCEIVDNIDERITFGGGVAARFGSVLTLERTLVANNFAWAAGGAALVDYTGVLDIDRATLVGNQSTTYLGDQGGIADANGGTLVVHDSILWDNSGSAIDHFIGAQGPVTVDYCDLTGGYEGSGNLDADPRFIAGTYQLQATSPCVDAGDPQSDPDPDGSPADMGAFPLSSPPLQMTQSSDVASISAGVSVGFEMQLSESSGGAGIYWLLGSFGSSDSGFGMGDLWVPLAIDDYLLWTALSPNTAPLSHSLGLIFGAVPQTAQLSLPAGTTALVGQTVRHSALLFEVDQNAFTFATPAQALTFTP